MVDRLVNSEANARRVSNVEQCFGVSGQPLSVQGRVLVGEGVLTKLCRKKPKPRQFFLFNDILVYGNIVINKKKYNKQHIIPLDDVKLQSVDDEEELKNGWMIKSPSKSFVVYAATATEKSEWMAHINKCVQDLLTRRGNKKQSVDDSPIWVPDSATKMCMNCKKTEFSFVNRRHHCRQCGQVVCGNCSTKKWLLASQSSKELRVCDKCYEQLSSGQDPAQNDTRPPPVQANINIDTSGESSSDDDDDDDETEQGKQNTNEVEPTFYQGNQ